MTTRESNATLARPGPEPGGCTPARTARAALPRRDCDETSRSHTRERSVKATVPLDSPVANGRFCSVDERWSRWIFGSPGEVRRRARRVDGCSEAWLTQVHADAVHDGIVAGSPCSRRTFPGAGEQRPFVATADQVWALHAQQLGVAVLLGAFVGLRTAEVCGLRVPDVGVMRGMVSPGGAVASRAAQDRHVENSGADSVQYRPGVVGGGSCAPR